MQNSISTLSTKEIRSQVSDWKNRASMALFFAVFFLFGACIQMSTGATFNQQSTFSYGAIAGVLCAVSSILAVYWWVRSNSLQAELLKALQEEAAQNSAAASSSKEASKD